MLNQFKKKIKIKIQKKLDNPDIKRLKEKGLKVGANFQPQEKCIIDENHCWLISIGNNVTLAPRVHLLAHDASTKMFLGYTKIGKVSIGNNVFIGASSIILPNITIGDNVIIGAGSVVTKDIPSNVVAVGNPAKVISDIDTYLEKNKLNMQNRPLYDKKWTTNGNITNDMKNKMIEDLNVGIGYVE